ncbi:lysoplasmalogenase isoform X2 [Cololabis saira]|nr:lysoplasmalogenase isoform X2 [Cololabis saira]
MLPFFLSSALYFYLWTPDSPPSLVSAGVKAAPAVLLAAAVLSWNGGQSVLGVAGGLIFSAVGDCCLVWPELFLHGMGAFAVAHLFYSLTFLSRRYATYSSPSSLNRFLYLILFLVGGGVYIYLYPFLRKAPDSNLLTPGVGVYIVLIVAMAGLAIRTRHTATLLGSLTFMVSDATLALQVFKAVPPMQNGQIVVMVTYYLAQLLIAMGDIKAVETTDFNSKWKKP